MDEAKRLKDLERENQQLKRLVTDQALDILMLKEVAKVVSVAAQRGLIDASQQCRGCAEDAGEGRNLCERCYERVLGEKFSDYA